MFFTVGDSYSGYKFYSGMTVTATIGGNGNITATGSIAAASAQITNDCTIGGNLTVSGFYSTKPYVGGFVSSAGVVSTTIKPGYITPTVAKTTGTYGFTLPTAHPSGANYTVFVQQQSTSSSIVAVSLVVWVESSTKFTVWSRSASNVLTDASFYVYTVP